MPAELPRTATDMDVLVYQALMVAELADLSVDDLDLDNATLFIKGGGRGRSRVLPLEAKQMILAERYLMFDRPSLLKEKSATLFIGKTGTSIDIQVVQSLVKTMRELFPERKLNPTTIRQSVLVNLFKQGWDIRDVQLFAGHDNASTTEWYRPSDLSELTEGLQRWHPLG